MHNLRRLPASTAIAALVLACDCAAQTYPDALYFKFDEGGGTSTQNVAIPALGTNPAPIIGHTLAPGAGQFGGGLAGVSSPTGDHFVATGWGTDFGTGDWTIGLWLDMSGVTGDPFGYVFGDLAAGDFRVFANGQAGSGNLMMRGPLAEVQAIGGAPATGPAVTAFVYDSTVPEIRAYVNGALVNTVAQSPLNLVGSSFQIAGYVSASAARSLPTGGFLDEFRVFRRALTAAEIAATWNVELSPTGLLANFTAAPLNGNAPLAVQFQDQSSTTEPGGVTAWQWDFDDDGTIDSTEQNPVHVYGPGTWSPRLRVFDGVNPPAEIVRIDWIEVGPYVLTAATNGNGDLTITAPPPPPGTQQGFTLISATPAPVLGGGPFLGLIPDAFTQLVLQQPPLPGNLFHFVPAPGFYPDTPYVLPPGSLSPLAGVTFDLVVVYFVGFQVEFTNTARVTL